MVGIAATSADKSDDVDGGKAQPAAGSREGQENKAQAGRRS